MYHVKVTFTTALRVFRQLSHDHRTVALIFVVPCLLLALLRWMFESSPQFFNHMAPALLGIFPFVLMFIVTSITTLRERRSGTLERLMTMPIGKLDFMLGYMIAFGVLAIIQALLASALLLYGFDLPVAGSDWLLVTVALLDALLGAALGLLVSAFAQSEFQAVQFMPAFVMPQILIGGLFMPVDAMPDLLQAIANALPLTYAIAALNEISLYDTLSSTAQRDLWVIGSSVVLAIILGALTLRRRTR